MTVSLLGLVFDNVTLQQAAARIAARPAGAPFAYIVTPNADHLVRLARAPDLQAIYRQASLCLLDSRVVGRLACLLGLRSPRVVTGSDLTADLLRHHLLPGERITIIGMQPDHVVRLRHRLGLSQPAHHEPPMGFDVDPVAMDAAVAFVRAHPSRLVFLAVGSPRQEYLAAELAAAGDITGTGLCIGASLAFLAGVGTRAPWIVQHLGLEWLFRLATEPGRLWRRYLLHSPRVIVLLLRQRVAG